MVPTSTDVLLIGPTESYKNQKEINKPENHKIRINRLNKNTKINKKKEKKKKK